MPGYIQRCLDTSRHLRTLLYTSEAKGRLGGLRSYKEIWPRETYIVISTGSGVGDRDSNTGGCGGGGGTGGSTADLV